MKSKFTEEEIKDLNDVIKKYDVINNHITEYQNQADELEKKVLSLMADKERIRKELEIPLMERLRKKYGNFSLNEVANIIQNDR